MAFDTERAARRLTDAGMDERAANGVADVVHNATEGLATEASVTRLEAKLDTSIATLRADIYRALWLQGMGILAGTAAIVTIINVLG